MLIKTINELRTYLPAHTMQNLESMLGFFKNSEQDFLRERLGGPLLTYLNRYYDGLPAEAMVTTYDDPADDGIDVNDPWYRLVEHAQRCIVYNAFERAADINAVSVSNSGINLISAEGYEVAGKDPLKAYKDRLWKETHNAVDQMLIFLEELAAGEYIPDEDDESKYTEEAESIVELWKKSRYYYLADGLLINTASRFNDFVNIEDNRERFVELLPDMRFVQRNYLRTEVGAERFDQLLADHHAGTLDDEDKDIVFQLQQLLALYTQERSRVFKLTTEERKRIEEECIGLKRELLASIEADAGDDGVVNASADGGGSQNCENGNCCCNGTTCQSESSSDSSLNDRYWGDKGGVFVMPGLI